MSFTTVRELVENYIPPALCIDVGRTWTKTTDAAKPRIDFTLKRQWNKFDEALQPFLHFLAERGQDQLVPGPFHVPEHIPVDSKSKVHGQFSFAVLAAVRKLLNTIGVDNRFTGAGYAMLIARP